MPNIALMVDCETLSLAPNALILQVGVCKADLDTGEIIVPAKNFWLSQQDQADRDVSASTQAWWQAQAEHVQRAVFGDDSTPRTSREQLAADLADLAKDCSGVWSWRPTADMVWIKTLLGTTPWSYKIQYDLATIGAMLDPTKALAPPDNQMGHDGAADADWQMQYLIRLWQLKQSRGL